MNTENTALIEGKTLAEWDQDWDLRPDGLLTYQHGLKELIGVYRIIENGRVIFIGVGTAPKVGIAKRISDLIRPSPSGRRYRSGQYVYENRHKLQIEVLIVGEVGNEAAARASKALKQAMIERDRPKLNVAAKVIAHLTRKG